ncbi:MAG: discoidin domain-containing protein [Polyangiales bacterium]
MRQITVGIAGLLWVAAAGCSREAPAEQIRLEGPAEAQRVVQVDRLTDGERSFEGSAWNSETAAIFRGSSAYVIFDLGDVTPIDAVYLQGDNNDEFILETSEDGTRFTTLWTAPAVGEQGLRARWASGLGGRARFAKLSAIGGDPSVSASEIQLFSATPSVWPPEIPVQFEFASSIWARLALLLFAVIATLTVLFHRREARTLVSSLLWATTLMTAGVAVYFILLIWPVEASVIDVSRAVCGAVACAVVLRLGLRPEHARQGLLTGLLASMAFMSILTFYNFGHPQFFDFEGRKPSYVHTWDMRVYFPFVKYFDELGYDGVYLASVKAYADEKLDGSLDRIEDTQLRDLSDYEMRSVSEVAEEIHAVKGRFSPERWTEFKQDMSYFWKTMGPRAYLNSLRDHGGNATPAWLLVAYAIYGSAEASEATFLWGALLDPLLLLLFFIVAWRTFGMRAALVCMVAYGATTIYQFGSNWGGSTLRNDWMVLLGLGVCALASRRWFLAGLLLGWGAMIRAFPVLALVFLAAPIAWRLFAAVRKRRTGSDDASPLSELLPLVKVGAGVFVVVVVLGSLSASRFGIERSWGAWSQKISMHANKPNVNHIGIIASVSYEPDNLWNNLRARGEDPKQWGPLTAQTMKNRRWITTLGMLLYTLLGIAACRRLRLADAAVIGTLMIPIYFYPANYYLHILFIWPLLLAPAAGLARSRDWSLVAAAVLAFCSLQWFGWLIPSQYGQFILWSGMFLGLIAILLLIALHASKRTATFETV